MAFQTEVVVTYSHLIYNMVFPYVTPTFLASCDFSLVSSCDKEILSRECVMKGLRECDECHKKNGRSCMLGTSVEM